MRKESFIGDSQQHSAYVFFVGLVSVPGELFHLTFLKGLTLAVILYCSLEGMLTMQHSAPKPVLKAILFSKV